MAIRGFGNIFGEQQTVIDAYRKINGNNLADLVRQEMRFSFDEPEASDSKGAREARQKLSEQESISDGFSDEEPC
ncbi:hypothetical protein Leryth_005372 [Lithospermum erythrorhizon]|nr:hypothetical protein Leryth_005372 [Lithospermum erythrorhizon]